MQQVVQRIDGRQLTACEISADGSQVRLGVLDAAGNPAMLTLPVDQAGALGMTLPSVVEQALRLRYRDESLRYVHPLGDWVLELASESGVVMLTLRTSDGFGVCFALQPAQREVLAEALGDARAARLAESVALRAH